MSDIVHELWSHTTPGIIHGALIGCDHMYDLALNIALWSHTMSGMMH